MFRPGLFQGKRILVTGGGTGLGRSMAEKYLELGGTVIICGRRLSVLEEAAHEMMEQYGANGGSVECEALNIKSFDAVEEVVGNVWARGPIDVLINNAAGNFVSPTENLSPRAFHAIADIVFSGTFYMTQACGKRWLAEERKGAVISIVVSWVWTGSAFVVPSAMSKAGIAAMTQSLAVEWGGRGIRLNAIAPGPFPTKGAWDRLDPTGKLFDQYLASVPMKRNGEPHELANLAAFLGADEAAYMNGQVIAIDGGQWLTGGGTFSAMTQVTPDQWVLFRQMIEATNAKDKADRAE